MNNFLNNNCNSKEEQDNWYNINKSVLIILIALDILAIQEIGIGKQYYRVSLITPPPNIEAAVEELLSDTE